MEWSQGMNSSTQVDNHTNSAGHHYDVAVLTSEIALIVAFVFWSLTLTSSILAQCNLAVPVKGLYYIILNLFCGWLSNLITNLLFYLDMTDFELGCQVVAKFSTTVYSIGALFLYLFLYERARYVSSIGAMGKVGRLAWWLTLSTPAVGILCMIFVTGEVNNKICLVKVPGEIVIVYIVADTFLSILYLTLFLKPVANGIAYFTNQSDQAMAEKLKKAAIRNFVCSIGAVLSTFLSMCFNTYTSYRPVDEYTSTFTIWTIFSTVLGASFTSAFMLGMSSVWIPYRSSSSPSSSSGEKENGKHVGRKNSKRKFDDVPEKNVVSEFKSSLFLGNGTDDEKVLEEIVRSRGASSRAASETMSDSHGSNLRGR